MSSGFTSGGTNEAPIQRSDEWLAAQLEIEANRARKAAEARQHDGKSLFETLEANKAAKQDAFEEANRLKNQFRALDEDEIEFLDSVLESTRAEEERVKKETADGLEIFRKQQDEIDRKARVSEGLQTDENPPVVEEAWAAGGRKRKRNKEVLKGVKIRRASSSMDMSTEATKTDAKKEEASKHVALDPKASPSVPVAVAKAPEKEPSPPVPAKTGLGLVDYGSDDDD